MRPRLEVDNRTNWNHWKPIELKSKLAAFALLLHLVLIGVWAECELFDGTVFDTFSDSLQQRICNIKCILKYVGYEWKVTTVNGIPLTSTYQSLFLHLSLFLIGHSSSVCICILCLCVCVCNCFSFFFFVVSSRNFAQANRLLRKKCKDKKKIGFTMDFNWRL